MQLDNSNYFSPEADREYFSVSQYKSFKDCEARTMAKLDGIWEENKQDAFLLGSYVHSWCQGEEYLEEFKINNPSLFKKDGTLYAKYALGDEMIKALANDPMIEKVRQGEKEVIFTGELFGAKWKTMLDIYNPDRGYFADLKTTREIHKKYWNENIREWENFIVHYDYLTQMAVYAEIERLNSNRDTWLQPHIIAVSKEEIPDKAVILMGTNYIKDKLDEMEIILPRIILVKQGKIEPIRCETCNYCRSTKKIDKVIHYMDL